MGDSLQKSGHAIINSYMILCFSSNQNYCWLTTPFFEGHSVRYFVSIIKTITLDLIPENSFSISSSFFSSERPGILPGLLFLYRLLSGKKMKNGSGRFGRSITAFTQQFFKGSVIFLQLRFSLVIGKQLFQFPF
jgi:hypothetical protein